MKHKKFYTVEISYRAENEIKLFRITNLDAIALKRFREDIFICGVYRKIDDSTGEIISPYSIRETIVYLQDHFFSASADLSKGLQNDKSIYSPKK